MKTLRSTSLAWKLAWGCKHVGKSQLVGQYREQGIKWGSRFLERDLGTLKSHCRSQPNMIGNSIVVLATFKRCPWPPETGTTGVSLEWVWRTGGVWILRAPGGHCAWCTDSGEAKFEHHAGPCHTMPHHPREVLRGKVTVCHGLPLFLESHSFVKKYSHSLLGGFGFRKTLWFQTWQWTTPPLISTIFPLRPLFRAGISQPGAQVGGWDPTTIPTSMLSPWPVAVLVNSQDLIW